MPVRDGDRTVLVVLLPGRLGDTVEATTSRPGEPVRRTSAFVHDRFALVPVTSPESVTRVRVLARGRAVVDTIPAGSLLGPDVPRTVDRVVTTSGGPPTQPVQVRTDGRTACRFTVGGFWVGPAYVPWNPFDAACARSTAGCTCCSPRTAATAAWRGWRQPALSPCGCPGGTVRRPRCRSTDDSAAPAFVDNGGQPPLQLVRAEALDQQGQVLASAMP